jgi:hypothetical protein
MPDNTERTPIQGAWIKFVGSVRLLLVPQPDDRPLDHFLPFRDAVLILVQNEQFLTELNAALQKSSNIKGLTEVHNALLLELQAFSLAAEVAQTTGKPEEAKGWWKTMLDRASTVTGSVKDLVEKLPYVKSALTLFMELIEIFKGRE